MVWLLFDMANSYSMRKPDSMVFYLEEAIDLSEYLGFARGEVASKHRLSLYYQFKGEKDLERELTRSALHLAEREEITQWLGNIYNHLGIIYFWELKYDSAFYAYTEAEKIAKSLGNEYILWESRLNFYRLFAAQEQNLKAEKELEAAHAITRSKGIRMDLGYVLGTRTQFYFKTKQWDKYAAASEDFLQFLNERSNKGKLDEHHLTLFDSDDENLPGILENLETIIPFHLKQKNYLSLLQVYRYMGNVKSEMQDQLGAIRSYKQGIIYAEMAGYQHSALEMIKRVQELYEARGELPLAYPYLKKYQQGYDSLNNIEVQKNLSELEVKYETAQKDRVLAENQLELETSKQVQRTFIILTLAGLLVSAVALWFLYFKTRTNRLLSSQKLMIEKSLDEKEFLLKEIHHRVKNNLQVISSLLNWQSQYIEDDKALESMQEGRNRVQSMALIHQNLYQSENLTGVEVHDYITKLSDSLFHSYNVRKDQIQFKSSIQPINLDVDTLIPLGLILNELLSNALKHAFPNGREGTIAVSLFEQNDTLRLEVKDNGIGMPEDVAKKAKGSFGHKLVEAFAEKLKAQLQIERGEGTRVNLLIRNYKAING